MVIISNSLSFISTWSSDIGRCYFTSHKILFKPHDLGEMTKGIMVITVGEI